MKTQRQINLAAGIAANRQPVTPEQMLIICTELREVWRIAYENTGVSNKAAALEYFKSWITRNEKQARREINMRDFKNES